MAALEDYGEYDEEDVGAGVGCGACEEVDENKGVVVEVKKTNDMEDMDVDMSELSI